MQIRDGPAAVTERFEATQLIRAIAARRRKMRRGDEKAGRLSSGVRRPTNAVRAAAREGRTLSNRHPRLRKRIAGLPICCRCGSRVSAALRLSGVGPSRAEFGMRRLPNQRGRSVSTAKRLRPPAQGWLAPAAYPGFASQKDLDSTPTGLRARSFAKGSGDATPLGLKTDLTAVNPG